MKDAASQITETGGNILDKTKGLGYGTESPALDILDKIKEPAPAESIFADDAAFDSSSVGSSILNNTIMNPAAAASLYEGDLDQALANRAAPRMAARGGITSLVS